MEDTTVNELTIAERILADISETERVAGTSVLSQTPSFKDEAVDRTALVDGAVIELFPSRRAGCGSKIHPPFDSTDVASLTVAQPPDPPSPAAAQGDDERIRWWDLLAIIIWAYVGGVTFCFTFALCAAVYFAMEHRTDDALAAAISSNFYFSFTSQAVFDISLLLAMRRVLRKRRGRGSLARYFRPIGGRTLFCAALSGLAAYGLVLALWVVLWWAARRHGHPTPPGGLLRPRSLGQLAMSGLVLVVLTPLAEEIFYRGLLLEWWERRLPPLLSALLTAAIFGLSHWRFLGTPPLFGWTATAVVAAGGFMMALWAQRTRSLRAPVAAHATYNAALISTAFLAR